MMDEKNIIQHKLISINCLINFPTNYPSYSSTNRPSSYGNMGLLAFVSTRVQINTLKYRHFLCFYKLFHSAVALRLREMMKWENTVVRKQDCSSHINIFTPQVKELISTIKNTAGLSWPG